MRDRNPAHRLWGSARGSAWRHLTISVAVSVLLAGSASAAPVRVRNQETSAHGFVVLTDLSGTTLAHGELVQWLERGAVANELVFHFRDGSLYDETVRFSQRRVFQLLSYRLVQRGPSFTATTDVEFDRSGRYRARYRPAPDKKEEEAAGSTDIPDDVSNGITSMLLKNLAPNGSAMTHLMSFSPKPRVVELHLRPEGVDRYWTGDAAAPATRYLIEPKVPGVTGVVATVIGKQPPSLRMWIAQGRAPTLVKFEGPLYVEGPPWRIELSGPQWKE